MDRRKFLNASTVLGTSALALPRISPAQAAPAV
ncbi:twin-arginine translocation signal domain-containing protein, partial [Polaromonas sp.]